jgi:hypothetical protein
MKPEDAEAIGKFVADMIHAGSNDERQGLVEELKHHFSGKPGSGECICDQSPETLRKTCEERWFEPFEKTRANMILDHRCPKHGEKAQPALWGRHKEKTLSVTPAQWLSLGVTYP